MRDIGIPISHNPHLQESEPLFLIRLIGEEKKFALGSRQPAAMAQEMFMRYLVIPSSMATGTRQPRSSTC
ncbi:MAG: hypothetical protein BWK74_00775 [Desulfobacteraceae bacterium A6]|nr:MAG: hypothetical protein BWK74_00775 [Desulfobacteraceae bacterium A6]